MVGYQTKKEIIFFNPGTSGVVFSYPAKQYIPAEVLVKVQESLVQETRNPVVYVEDRRLRPRKKKHR